jgi:hypothetical protein
MNENMSTRKPSAPALRTVEKKELLTIPPATVQTTRMLPQLVDNLVHLERGGDGLDQDSRANAPASDPEQILRHAEDIVPKASLKVVLHLGEAVNGA